MRRQPTPPPTFEELLARVRDLPDGYRGHVLDGELYVADPPSPGQAHTVAEISATLVAGSALGDPVPEGWSFLANVDIAFGNDGFLVADVAGWRIDKDRLAEAASPVRIAPAWVCEVLGASTRCFTLTAKRRAWAELGVQHLWVADPESHVLDVFQNQRGKWLLLASISDEQRAVAAPFEHFHFDADDLWTPPAPRSSRAGPPGSSRRRA